MIVCVCNALGEAACRETAGRPDCRTVACVYRLQGARIRCGRCLAAMETLWRLEKARRRGGAAAGVSRSAPAAPAR